MSLDFGLVLPAEPRKNQIDQTKDRAVVGTPQQEIDYFVMDVLGLPYSAATRLI